MASQTKLNVLFMQSQSYWGADSKIHGLIMQHLDRQRHNVHVAVDPGSPDHASAAVAALTQVHNLYLHTVNFGVSVNHQTPTAIVRQTLFRGPSSLLSLIHLARYARRHRISIIHGTEKPRDAFYGYLLSRLVGAKLIVHLHVKVENWISPLTRWAMKRAAALIGVSKFVEDSAIGMGYPADRSTHVLNALDCRDWDPSLSGEAIRAEYRIPPRAPLLVVISRLFQWKGHTELIRSLAVVKAQCPNVVLLIVGEDDPRGGPGHNLYSGELRELVAALGLSQHVVFAGYRSDIPELLAAANVFTMPSYEEPFGMVYLEAMAMKKPVIALESGGVPEIVDHGKSGLLSQSGNIEQLAGNILTLIDDSSLRMKMGEYGRRQVETRFAPTRLARDVEQVYRWVLNLPPR